MRGRGDASAAGRVGDLRAAQRGMLSEAKLSQIAVASIISNGGGSNGGGAG